MKAVTYNECLCGVDDILSTYCVKTSNKFHFGKFITKKLFCHIFLLLMLHWPLTLLLLLDLF